MGRRTRAGFVTGYVIRLTVCVIEQVQFQKSGWTESVAARRGARELNCVQQEYSSTEGFL